VIAAIVLILAVPVVTWWLVGDQSTTKPDNADYVVRPPFRMSKGVTRVVGAASLTLALAAAAWLIYASASASFDNRWWSVIGPMLLLGVLLGVGWRVFTAGVVGANIGAGIFAFVAGPVILAIVAWVIFRTVTLLS
jgi:hypothetical protein